MPVLPHTLGGLDRSAPSGLIGGSLVSLHIFSRWARCRHFYVFVWHLGLSFFFFLSRWPGRAIHPPVTDVNETHDSGDGEPVSPVDVDVDVGVADGSGDGAEAAAGNDDDGAGGAGDGDSAGNAAGGAEHTAGSTGANVTVANDTGAGVASTAEADNPLADLAGRLVRRTRSVLCLANFFCDPCST